MDVKTCAEQLQSCVAKPVLVAEPMQKHTSFRVGGPADYFAEPQTIAELQALLTQAKALKLPVTVIGNGTNLLVKDGGIRGLVIKLAFKQQTITDNTMVLGSGVPIILAAKAAAAQSLTGLEFAAGIPGSLGGAVYMNAGAYDGEMAKVVQKIQVLDQATGEINILTNADLDFSYRHSALQQNDKIVLEVTLKLAQGNQEAILEKMAKFNESRLEKQPLNYPNAGSTFKRPQGYAAAALIDQAGLKGFTVGGAQVSTKHAGFVVNVNKATAKDILDLMAEVQKCILAKNQVQLEPEVLILGEDA